MIQNKIAKYVYKIQLPMNDIFWGFMSSAGGAGTGVCKVAVCRFSVGLSHEIGI